MGRLQELAAQARAQARRPEPRAIRRWTDLAEAVKLHPVARRLDLAFSPERLLADLARIEEGWWERHLGPYHDGSWESVALWAPRGDRREQRSFGGTYAATEALGRCPYFGEVMAAFRCDKSRVRLMRLGPGGHILRHTDPLHQIGEDVIRVHVPVATVPEVRFMVRDRLVVMEPGEVWHIDVRFPHEVHNQSTIQRVHLVLDLFANPAIRQMLRSAQVMDRGFLGGYYLRHSLPAGLRKALKVGN